MIVISIKQFANQKYHRILISTWITSYIPQKNSEIEDDLDLLVDLMVFSWRWDSKHMFSIFSSWRDIGRINIIYNTMN